MKRIFLSILAIGGLALTLVPAVFVFTGAMASQTNKLLMLLGMVVWFAVAPFWIRRSQ